MQACRLLHYGTGLDQQYDGYIINGCALIKADPLIYSAEISYISYEDSPDGLSMGETLRFKTKTEFDEFRDNDTEGYSFYTEERTEGLAECGYRYAHVVLDGEHYYSPNLFGYFDTECENNLVQLEINGKWGYADTETGEIVIKAQWDWCGPFYGEYAMIRMGCPGKPGARMPQIPGYYKDDGHSFTIDGVEGQKFVWPIDEDITDPNYGWEWTMKSRCGYINKNGEIAIALKYVDGDPIARNGFFIVREPEGLIGVVDVNDKTIIDFTWYGIEKYESAYSPSWNGFVTYTNPAEKCGSLYSLYSLQGQLIVDNLDVTPNEYWPYPSEQYYKIIETWGRGACERYLIIWRGGKLGAVTNGRLLHEPTLEWKELCSLIKEDWEANKPAEEDEI